jgi:argininosuccinate lyase
VARSKKTKASNVSNVSNVAWGGRFKTAPASGARAFTASIGFDVRLYPYDIRGSIAHARMLAHCGIIQRKEAEKIVAGLRAVGKEIESGRFTPTLDDEDIHMAIERRLTEKIGAVGGKLHTARSRNDQVITDVRMFLKDAVDEIDGKIASLQKTLVAIASKHVDAIMPGYTHLQRAQPVLLGHHLLAYHDMLDRDRERFADCRRRADVLPLGAGAIAGTTLPIDRAFTAKQLGFARVAENSMDAVSDRDFIAEFLADGAILFAHLSRLAGEITMWVTSEFGFAALDDAYSTGSSMMPQKKNPDIAELVRGKAGRVYGNLISLLTTLKGLPLAYNSDLQEDKEPLFDTTDTAIGSLGILAELLRSLRFDTRRMRLAASDGFLLATDIAEYLVGAGLPFREAHETTGKIVLHCLERGVSPTDLSLGEFSKFSGRFGADIIRLLTPEQSVARRRSLGGTAPANLKARLKKLGRT